MNRNKRINVLSYQDRVQRGRSPVRNVRCPPNRSYRDSQSRDRGELSYGYNNGERPEQRLRSRSEGPKNRERLPPRPIDDFNQEKNGIKRRETVGGRRRWKAGNERRKNGEYQGANGEGSNSIYNQRSNEGLKSNSTTEDGYNRRSNQDFHRALNTGRTSFLNGKDNGHTQIVNELGLTRISEIKVGYEFEVVIRCNVEMAIYAVVLAEDVDRIDEMNENIDTAIRNGGEPMSFRKKKGDYAAGYYDGKWYRVQIMGWAKHRESVLFTELGIKHKVEMHDLRELPDNFKSFPRFSFKVKVVDFNVAKNGRLAYNDHIRVKVVSLVDPFTLGVVVASNDHENDMR